MRHTRLYLDFYCDEMDDSAHALLRHWSALAKAVEIALELDNDDFVCWAGTFMGSPGDGYQGMVLVGSAELCEEKKVPRIARRFLNFDSLRTLVQKSRRPCEFSLRIRGNQLEIERPASQSLVEAAEKICAALK